MEDIKRMVEETAEISDRIDKRLELMEQLLLRDIELTNNFLEKLNKIGKEDGK